MCLKKISRNVLDFNKLSSKLEEKTVQRSQLFKLGKSKEYEVSTRTDKHSASSQGSWIRDQWRMKLSNHYFFFFMRRVQKKQAHAVKVGFLSQRSKINKSFLVLIQAK